jgi:hypothetical protein
LSVAQSICCGIAALFVVAIPLTLYGRFVFFPYVAAGAVGIRIGWNMRFVNGKPIPQDPTRAGAFAGLRVPLSLPWMASESMAEWGLTSPSGMAVAELVAALPFILSAASTWVLHKADPILFGLLVGLPLSIYVLHRAAQNIILVYRSLRGSSNRAAYTTASTPTSDRAVSSYGEASACEAAELVADPGTPPDLDESQAAPLINLTARTKQSGGTAYVDDVELHKHEEKEGYVLGDDPIEYLGDRALSNAPPLLSAAYHVALGFALLSILVIALINLHTAYDIGHSLRLYSAAAAYVAGAIQALKLFFSGKLRLWHIVLYIDAVWLLSALGIVLTPVEVWRALTGS